MKIAQVCPYFYPHVGGVESHVLTLSKELVKRGHEVHVLTALLPGMKERETIDGIKVKRIKPRVVWFKTPVIPKVKKAIRDLKAGVVHAHSPPPLPSYYAAKACSAADIPFMITYHCDLELPSLTGRFVAEFYRRTFGNSTIKKSDKVIVTTNTYAATSRTVWNATPIVIPMMVDTEEFSPEVSSEDLENRLGLPKDKPKVLFVGRLTKHKGVEYILEASKSLDACFIIVGGGELEDQYKNEIDRLGAKGKVTLAGRVDDDALPKYYSISDVCVLPSTSRLEAFGIVALEAMATGKPVVISDIPGVRELITDGEEGLLVEPMNPDDLAAKISLITSDREKMVAMGKKARQKVKANFTVKKVVDRLVAVYDEISKSQ